MSASHASAGILHLVSLPEQSKPSTRTAALGPNEDLPNDLGFERVEGGACTLWWMKLISCTRGLSARLGGDPLKYGGEHPKLNESPQPLLLRNMSRISTPGSDSLYSGEWLRCRLVDFESSGIGFIANPTLRGFGQKTTSSHFSLMIAALSLPISFISPDPTKLFLAARCCMNLIVHSSL